MIQFIALLIVVILIGSMFVAFNCTSESSAQGSQKMIDEFDKAIQEYLKESRK